MSTTTTRHMCQEGVHPQPHLQQLEILRFTNDDARVEEEVEGAALDDDRAGFCEKAEFQYFPGINEFLKIFKCTSSVKYQFSSCSSSPISNIYLFSGFTLVYLAHVLCVKYYFR